MRFTVAAAGLALVAGANAWANDTVYTTEVVTAYTTYCPGATSIIHGNSTYTVTEATTLTITNCPCTLTRPVYTSTVSSCTSCSSAPPASSTPASSSPPVFTNGTATSASSVPVPTSSAASSSSSPIATGAAPRALAASGAGLAGVLALAAYVL